MTVHIPLWIFQALAAYLLVGAVIWLPLQFWANRFVTPRRPALAWLRRQTWWVLLRAWVLTMPLWPWLIWDLAHDEWKYGIGKRVRLWYCCLTFGSPGCCSTCKGTGASNDAETNGLCWDCYGTGHAHP